MPHLTQFNYLKKIGFFFKIGISKLIWKNLSKNFDKIQKLVLN